MCSSKQGYNAGCLRHKFERAQFLRDFIKGIKDLSSCTVELLAFGNFFHSSLVLLKLPARSYITQECSRARCLFINTQNLTFQYYIIINFIVQLRVFVCYVVVKFLFDLHVNFPLCF